MTTGWELGGSGFHLWPGQTLDPSGSTGLTKRSTFHVKIIQNKNHGTVVKSPSLHLVLR